MTFLRWQNIIAFWHWNAAGHNTCFSESHSSCNSANVLCNSITSPWNQQHMSCLCFVRTKTGLYHHNIERSLEFRCVITFCPTSRFWPPNLFKSMVDEIVFPETIILGQEITKNWVSLTSRWGSKRHHIHFPHREALKQFRQLATLTSAGISWNIDFISWHDNPLPEPKGCRSGRT